MNADVLWVSRHPKILARGYADQGLLEAMLDRSLWRVAGGVDYAHHEAVGESWPKLKGAVVVLPARHHAKPRDVAWFKRNLAKLRWRVVVLAGDEEWTFPWRELEGERLWIMQPRPEHAEHRKLPGGWSPGTRGEIKAHGRDVERDLDWFFAGQVTHSRREECVAELKRLTRGELVETDGYMRGIDLSEYRAKLVRSKVVPCPSGPYTVDTNRPLEALEAGCVPVVDTVTPRGDDFDFWQLTFGPNLLLPVREWSELPQRMETALAGWPRHANLTFAWWQRWKRRACKQMDADVREASGLRRREQPEDLITALVVTSPTEGCPDTGHIEETVASVREQLPRCEIVVAFDGVRPEQRHLGEAYEEYVRRVLWLCNFEWMAVPHLAPEWGHQANTARGALRLVDTPQLLFMEHDTPLTGAIDWRALSAAVASGRANHVRMHIYDEIHPEHEHLMLDHETWSVKGAPMRRTVQWWQRPHLASTEFYRDRVMARFPESSRTMIEDKMHGVVQDSWDERGEDGWEEWRLWVYTPEGGFKRSGHLDARQGAPKFGMAYE